MSEKFSAGNHEPHAVLVVVNGISAALRQNKGNLLID